jgi:hypothetical protein
MNKKDQRFCLISRHNIVHFAKAYLVAVMAAFNIPCGKKVLYFLFTHSEGHAGMQQYRYREKKKEYHPG